MPRPFFSHPDLRRWLLVTVGLGLALLGTWGAMQTWLARFEAQLPAQQETTVLAALATIETAFANLQRGLRAEAQRVAEQEVMLRSMRLYQRTPEEGREQLVGHLAALSLPERVSIEVYDPTPQLIAWQGTSMPLDAAPSLPQFLESYQVATVTDGTRQQALVVWWPIRDGRRVLGVVRAMRLIGFEAPVQNQYLRDFSLAATWTRDTRLPVEVTFGDTPPPASSRGHTRILTGLDGRILGHVRVQPPSPNRLRSTGRGRFADVNAFWGTLLLAWLLLGLGAWRKAGLHRPSLPPWQVAGRFVVWGIAWWGVRYALLALNVPARWQEHRAPLAPLFDPRHLASAFGNDLFRSVGDLLLTAVFALVFGFAFVRLVAALRARFSGPTEHPRRWLLLVLVPGTAAATGGILWLLSEVVQHTILDSTLGYFSRSGLLPERLVLLVFGGLLMLTLAAALLGTGTLLLGWLGVARYQRSLPTGWAGITFVGGLTLFFAGSYALGGDAQVPWPALLLFLAVCGPLAAWLLRRNAPLDRTLLTLRNVLPAIFLLTLLIYPLLHAGMDQQRRARIEEAARSFEEGRDAGVLYAVEQVLNRARRAPEVQAMLSTPERAQPQFEATAAWLLRRSLLTTLGAYDVSLTVFDATGTPLGRYTGVEQSVGRFALAELDRTDFGLLQEMYAEANPAADLLVEKMTGRREHDRFQYQGIAPLQPTAGGVPLGWVMVRVEPQPLYQDRTTPFPQVLVPAGFYGTVYADLSLAEFRDGALVRSLGQHFGRYRLAAEVAQQLRRASVLWHAETVKEQRYLTYYRRQLEPTESLGAVATPRSIVTAVRVPEINLFDHLYFLLRLTLAGICFGLPVYLVGLYLRRRAGLLPAPRTHYRDKVLNAFFGVGIVAVTTMGVVGLQVFTGENDRAIQSWLRQHLERIEEALVLEARGNEMPYRALDRIPVDSLAARVGLDLNVYKGTQLVRSSYPQLIEDRLIDARLPIEAYEDLFYRGFRTTNVTAHIGTFSYTAGFRALPDEQGRPYYILSVPTLPEQERIEEERARNIAYLFGALLLLLVMLMLTAGVLANALARPIARLRRGLERVAQGRFERIPPVRSRDEISDLVTSFNTMQQQLAESRHQLAQQERQLAWREMARQVAHEIKNPLTPMKLSVQHLQRAYEGLEPNPSDPKSGKFAGLFERITGTLIEQMDTLARIANEFSSFARMPRRVLEPLDLNQVVEEAVALMQEEQNVEIYLDLHPGPLMLQADREELRRIYINLLKNGIQAIPENQAGRLTVTTTRGIGDAGQPVARSTVTDNGTGIPEELHDKIFVPNFSTKTSGTGLGLAITKKGIEDLSGEIDFVTAAGEGTTFRICLPIDDSLQA